MEGERNATAGQRRMLVEPEQFLDAERDRRAAFGFVVDRRRGPGRRLEMGRRLVVEAPRQVPGQRRVEGARKVIGADLVELRLADEERREPAGIGGQGLVRQVRPRLALGAAQEHHPVATLLERFRPRQARDAKRKNAARQRQRSRLVLRDGERLLGEDERAEPATATRPQRCGGAVEAQFVRGLDRRASDPFDVVERERRSRENTRRGGAAGDFADGEIRLARQRIMRFQRRRPAVGHEEFAAPAARSPRCDRGRPRRAGRRLSAAAPSSGRSATFSGGRDRSALPRPPGEEDAPFSLGEKVAEGRMRASARCASPRARRLASSARGERSRRKASSRIARSTASPPSPRSVSTTAISLAIPPSPARAASTTMRARRGGSARLAIARPSSVMRPSPSMAPIAVRSARASLSAARGGGSRKASFAGSATPQRAQSSARPERSAERISGAA